jgi:hypothetical protein
MFAIQKPLSAMGLPATAVLIALFALAHPAAAATPDVTPKHATPATEPGEWQSHSYDFHFMGFTSTYSCDGLADKLKLLLRLAGARADAKVDPLCARGYGEPDKLAQAKVTFSTLQPVVASSSAAASSPPPSVAGLWRQVEFAPQHPFELQTGDCELIEQFRDKLLPMFATRNVAHQITCVPHQDSGSNFSLRFDVFAAAPAAKSP